eukprot:EC796732.1.p1 GENE.EC796732.1~~EC796732.1.p1  ORF type:complete len:133 (+),score=9.92 EC796732.1:47-445(+)
MSMFESHEGEYDGVIDDTGKRFGYGVMKWSNGMVYSGGWKEDLPDGIGTCQFPDGSRYEGQWKAGLFHGKGHYVSPDGSIECEGVALAVRTLVSARVCLCVLTDPCVLAGVDSRACRILSTITSTAMAWRAK